MDTVIKQISEIEAAASAVMDGANARKKAFAREMEAKTAAFDQDIDAQTEKRINDLRANMEVEMNSKLSKQKAGAGQMLARMEKNYQEHHTEYVKQLFQSLIEG